MTLRVLLMLCAAAVQAQTVADALAQRLLDRVRQVEASISGVVGFAAVDITTGTEIQYRGDLQFAQASVIKVPILVELYRADRAQRIRLNDSGTLVPKDAVGGSVVLGPRLKTGPVTITVRELAQAMISSSDNTATNYLIARLGKDRINAAMQELGFPNTRLQRIMLDSAAAKRNEENISTPLDMARLLAKLQRGEVVDAAASKEMLAILEDTEEDIRRTIPGDIAVSSKVGYVPGVRTEVAVVHLASRPYAIAIMSAFVDNHENPIPAIANAAHQHFVKLAQSNRYGNRLQ